MRGPHSADGDTGLCLENNLSVERDTGNTGNDGCSLKKKKHETCFQNVNKQSSLDWNVRRTCCQVPSPVRIGRRGRTDDGDVVSSLFCADFRRGFVTRTKSTAQIQRNRSPDRLTYAFLRNHSTSRRRRGDARSNHPTFLLLKIYLQSLHLCFPQSTVNANVSFLWNPRKYLSINLEKIHHLETLKCMHTA